MLLSNYSDIDYVFSLDFEDFEKLVLKLIESKIEEKKEEYEKDIEDKLYFRWVYEMPYLEQKISFQKYKELAFEKPKKKPKEYTEQENIKLIKRIEEVRKVHQGKTGE